MALPRLWIPPVVIRDETEAFALEYYALSAAERSNIDLWWRGINPFYMQSQTPFQSKWWTMGHAYKWTRFITLLQNQDRYQEAYYAYQTRVGQRLMDLQAMEARLGALVRDLQRRILSLEDGSAPIVDFGREWGPVQRVDTSLPLSITAGYACPTCLTILEDPWIARPGVAPYWYACTLDAPHVQQLNYLKQVCTFQWVDI
jgi:hypothetical protein